MKNISDEIHDVGSEESDIMFLINAMRETFKTVS